MKHCDCGYWEGHEDYCSSHPTNIAKQENEELQDLINSLRARIVKLEAIASAAASLMSEDDAQEALAHFNCLHILRDKLDELKEVPEP